MTMWMVLLDDGKRRHAYGPIYEREEADHFAEFLSTEVDPAKVYPLISPADELLGWWRNVKAKTIQP